MKSPRRMHKHPSLPAILLAAALLCLVCMGAVSAQSGRDTTAPLPGYGLCWFTVDGGGLTRSAGGGYSLGGTIGQPDAQALAQGGGYSLQGGFWLPVDFVLHLPLVLRQGGP